MMQKNMVFFAGAVLLLSGCSGVTGLMDASDHFGCPASDGINCTTLTQTYERERVSNVTGVNGAGIRVMESFPEDNTVQMKAADTHDEVTLEPNPHSHRATEAVMTLWILPWVDADGDLHGLEKLMVRTQDAHWNIKRVRSDAITELKKAGGFR